MMVSKWWNQKFWFNVCQHSFLFGSLNFSNSGKMCRPGDLAYFECWRFDIQSPLLVFTAKYLCRLLKINGSQIPISFSRCTVNCSFWSKNDNVRPGFYSASLFSLSSAPVFIHLTLNFKADVSTCIEFHSWSRKNSRALCQVSSGLAINPAVF